MKGREPELVRCGYCHGTGVQTPATVVNLTEPRTCAGCGGRGFIRPGGAF